MQEEALCNYAFSRCMSVIQSWLTTCPLLSPFPSLSLVPFIFLNRFPFHFYSLLSPNYLPLPLTLIIPICPIHREHKGRLSSLSYLDSEDVFEEPVAPPRTRTLPDRSYTIDTPYYSSDADKPSLKEKLTPPASSATGRAASPSYSREVDVFDSPGGRDATTTSASASRSPLRRSQSPAAAPLRSSPASERTSRVKTEERTTIISSSSSSSAQKASEPRYPLSRTRAAEEVPSSGSLYKQQPQPSSMEPKPPAVSRVSASLPRSYQRVESARLSSVVTPRPFGTQASRISSLPRASTVSTRRL